MVRLSFVVPVYNAEKYLQECIDSIRSVDEGDSVEFILVNDGSTDGSLDICNENAEKDPRIHVVSQSNQGSQAARNAGISVAAGEYICFVDSDDYINPDLGNKLFSVMDEYSPDVILYEAVRVSMKDGSTTKAGHDLESGYYDYDDVKAKLLPNMYVTHDLYGIRKVNSSLCMKCFKREILQKVVYSFDSSIELGEDLGITVASMMHVHSAYKLDDIPYYFYRNNPDSFMNRYKDCLFEKSIKLCNYMDSQNVEKNEVYARAVAYERCFFAISAYYNEYFFKSDRTSTQKKNVVSMMMDSDLLVKALDVIDFKEVRNPNRMILKMIASRKLGFLSVLGNFVYFLSPILRKIIKF